MKAEYAEASNVYNEIKVDKQNDKYTILEIEVNRINFITDKSIKASPPLPSSLSSPSPSQSPTTVSLYEKSPGQPKASSLSQSAGVLSSSSVVVVGGIGAVTAKIICWGEQWEAAAAAAAAAVSVSISCNACSKGSNGIKKLYPNQSSSQQQQQQNRKNQQLQRRSTQQTPQSQSQQQHQHNHHQHNKLRYCVRSKSLALFLEYLREIVANSVSDHAYDQRNSTPTEASGAARLPLPVSLQCSNSAAAKNNVAVDCNFVQDKTKIYALYRHVQSRGTSGQVQQQQQLKVAAIFQLRFNMLFAAAAAAASANKTVRIGAAATVPPPLPMPPPSVSTATATALPAALLQDHKLTIVNLSKSQPGEQHIAGTALPAPATVATPAKVELMEAMKKLDADLVALFAATAAAEPKMEKLKQQQLWRAEEELPGGGAVSDGEAEQQHQLELQLQEAAEQQLEEKQQVEQATPELFKQVNQLQLHLEALTLQPEGTKRMELLQSEVRPIFTVECQLSDELIRTVPRAPMFHIMQFESEKFQSLTQCTRFGQTQQRQVHMSQEAQQLDQQQQEKELGFIQFTIWWREPGTCLNELLGMGRLPLVELYRASLLEQCKCIVIQRRDLHLASLYLKISLRSDQQLTLPKQLSVEKNNSSNCNKNNNNSNSSKNNNNNSNNTSYHSAAAAANNNNNYDSSSSRAASTTTSTPSSAKTNNSSSSNNNSKASLESVHFMAETTKVRLLRGYIYAGETRQLSAADANCCKELVVLKPLWQPQELVVQLGPQGAFQLQEQFAIINDEKFLQSVERQQLQLDLRPLGGKVLLPLHQFYIAYRDASITNHLCKGKLPVISIDGWTPILHAKTQAKIGEIKVLLAIGSESQIAQLKLQRGLDVDNNPQQSPSRGTTDLLSMLQGALIAPSTSPVVSPASSTANNVETTFSFSLHIVRASGLPLNPGYGKSGKKQQAKRQAIAKRFPPNEPPSSYVTFQALNCNAQTYRSHEGLVYATPIVERSTTPLWQSKFQVEVSSDYLTNSEKLFILKVWKKTALSAGTSTEPTPLEDAIIGFAALNLNRKPNVNTFPSGWHNIVDFNGRVTGGLEIHVQPLPKTAVTASMANVDMAIDQFEQSLELHHLQIGQAIKRKFTELEVISNRLRTRMGDVTGEKLQSPQFDVDAALDNWQPPSELQQLWHEDDELAADFERALRTPTPPPMEPSTSAQNESRGESEKE